MDIGLAELGQMVGGAAAAFVATWVAFVRPLDRKVKLQGSCGEDIEAIKAEQGRVREELAKMTAQLKAGDDVHVRAEKAIEKIREKLANTVTDEEFAAYTQTMNQNAQTLVEKLGNATGAIEAWYRSQGGGR